ncbi:hypothetical protein TSAR_006608 [Trichomalopsis sarcophagae]|uniref:OTU domain-containing protein n=1 Tax=Trichomalopsis sarcophagae TaxID=543379 RepID=A0A232EJU4_9HYME|nr:hypothetical protein TSAR_006608 [Trichomalopsis sarcophagae]
MPSGDSLGEPAVKIQKKADKAQKFRKTTQPGKCLSGLNRRITEKPNSLKPNTVNRIPAKFPTTPEKQGHPIAGIPPLEIITVTANVVALLQLDHGDRDVLVIIAGRFSNPQSPVDVANQESTAQQIPASHDEISPAPIKGRNGVHIDVWEASTSKHDTNSKRVVDPDVPRAPVRSRSARDENNRRSLLMSDKSVNVSDFVANELADRDKNEHTTVVEVDLVDDQDLPPIDEPAFIEDPTTDDLLSDRNNPTSPIEHFDNFDYVPRNADRRAKHRANPVPSGDSHMDRFRIMDHSIECANPDLNLERHTDIPSHPPGNCLFYSLIKCMELRLSALELRARLANSPALKHCGCPEETLQILLSPTEFGDADCAFVFSKEFNQNICVHYHQDNGELDFWHITANAFSNYIHLHLTSNHLTPLLGAQIHTNNGLTPIPAGARGDISPNNPPIDNAQRHVRSDLSDNNSPQLPGADNAVADLVLALKNDSKRRFDRELKYQDAKLGCYQLGKFHPYCDNRKLEWDLPHYIIMAPTKD